MTVAEVRPGSPEPTLRQEPGEISLALPRTFFLLFRWRLAVGTGGLLQQTGKRAATACLEQQHRRAPSPYPQILLAVCKVNILVFLPMARVGNEL